MGNISQLRPAYRFASEKLLNSAIQVGPFYIHCKKMYAAVLNQKLYIGEYSGISSSKLKNS
jgi:hypothetical protein